jgi:hypothetical protein
MVRTTAALLALMFLAGCLHEAHRLEVTNAGVLEARVTVTYETWIEDGEGQGYSATIVDETLVRSGETARLKYPSDPLHVRIDRVVDGAVLYDEWLYDGDFEDEHDRIEIVVYP